MEIWQYLFERKRHKYLITTITNVILQSYYRIFHSNFLRSNTRISNVTMSHFLDIFTFSFARASEKIRIIDNNNLRKRKYDICVSIELTCTLASDKSNRIASSSLVNTSGYWVFPNAFSSSCSWYVVNVVRDLRTLRGRSDSPRFKRSDSPKFKGSWRESFIWWSLKWPSSVSPPSPIASDDVAWSENNKEVL